MYYENKQPIYTAITEAGLFGLVAIKLKPYTKKVGFKYHYLKTNFANNTERLKYWRKLEAIAETFDLPIVS